MRDHSNHVEVSREQAVKLLLGACNFKPEIETVPLDQAFGRTLAIDATAQLDMPNCLTCRMDSVAVHWVDFENGMPDTSAWERGKQWEFANTGIGMPEGFDTAIVIEHVRVSDDFSSISFEAAPSAQYAGTSCAGSKMKAGDVLVPAKSCLTPLLVSYIASGGNATVQVFSRPRVAFIPTGNELVRAGQPLPRAKNYESNSLLVRGKVQAWGGAVQVYDIVPDDPELIKQAVLKACSEADIVVLNAGSSKGSDDWNVEMLDEVGRILYHQTNHGPGHHSSGAVVEGVPVVGISGPPGGAAFTTDFYVRPLMQAFLGQPVEPEIVQARLAKPFPVRRAAPVVAQGVEAKGEDRPPVVQDGAEFFGIKQVCLTRGKDGVLEAWPFPTTHPAAPQADTADAYFALSSHREGAPYSVGDMIDVELRPNQV